MDKYKKIALFTGFLFLLALAWLVPQLPQYISFSPQTLTAQVAGTPTISLLPSRTSGVAPLAVFFDATGTTDPSTSNSFRDLHFVWDFGDPSAGTWQFSGKSKNAAIGGVAGHLFTTPGTYTVRLTVSNATGQSSSQTAVITVTNPDTVFSGANTRCVSTSGNFSGCPAGAEQITSSSVNSSILNQAGKRTLYRKGETFSISNAINLTNAGTTGSHVGAFPVTSSGKATFNVPSGNGTTGATNWRITDIFFNGLGAGGVPVNMTGGSGTAQLTVYNVDVERFNGCATFYSPQGHNREISFVNVTCKNFINPGSGTKFFEDTESSMFMGIEIDKGDINNFGVDQTEFNHRMVYFDKKIIQHNKYHGRAVGHSKNVLQIRHCFTSWGSKCINNTTRGQYLIVSDNHFLEEGGPQAAYVIRTCNESRCTSSADDSFPVENIIIERNLIQLDYDNPQTEPISSIFQINSARTTIRNNILDLQHLPVPGTSSQGPSILNAEAHPAGVSMDLNDIWFINNSIYVDGYPKGIRVCNTSAGGSGHRCNNNLIYVPGITGTITLTTGSNFASTQGNIIATTNPYTSLPGFLATFPQTALNFFSLSPSSSALNTGVTIPNMRTSDFTGSTLRTGSWDVGAFESGGGGTPPTQTCGNNIREGTEVCDGTQLNGQSCTTQGYTGGTLSCNASCTAFVTSACTNNPPSDTTPPTISVSAPSTGTTGTALTLSASASDNVGVAGVQFRVNGANQGSEDTTSPYSVSYTPTSAGTFTITAVARDTAGNTTTSNSVTITVSGTPPTQTCGNNIREGTEVCDGTQLNGQSCTTQGYTGGTLSCNASCTAFVTSACTNTTGTVTTLTLIPRLEGITTVPNRSTTIVLSNAVTGQSAGVYTQQSNAQGVVTITGLSLSTTNQYNIAVSIPYALRRTLRNIVPTTAPITLPILPVGDLNNDRSINVLDWDIMRTQWGTNNLTSDVNRDGVVNSIDFSYLNKNWMQIGE
jgi:hypothetical protein